MYNLFIFIKKYSAVILFILLELICFLMVAYSLPYHNRKMVSMSNSIAGGIYKTTSNWNDYLHLKSENEKLAKQNALLMNMVGEDYSEGDTVVTHGMFSFVPAHVIKNSIYELNNYMVVDKGRADGIEPDMGVVCSDGVVGIVVNVSSHYASVMSLLNSNTIVSARFVDNQYVANVLWDNQNYHFGVVKDIPSHLVINKGDTLVTSGFSNSYPPDILVGTIEETEDNTNEMFSTAKLKFSTNFSTLRHVFIVKNNYQVEIDSLCITH